MNPPCFWFLWEFKSVTRAKLCQNNLFLNLKYTYNMTDTSRIVPWPRNRDHLKRAVSKVGSWFICLAIFKLHDVHPPNNTFFTDAEVSPYLLYRTLTVFLKSNFLNIPRVGSHFQTLSTISETCNSQLMQDPDCKVEVWVTKMLCLPLPTSQFLKCEMMRCHVV